MLRTCFYNCKRVEGHGAKKVLCIAHRILDFFFLQFLFLLMLLHDVIYNVTTLI
jgi:hypothetical protein